MPPLPPGVGTGFVSVGDFLDANRGTLANETSQINAGVGKDIDTAKSAADALIDSDKQWDTHKQDYTALGGYGDALDKAIKAKDEATSLGSTGGLSDYFQKHMGDSHTQGDFDANLLGYDASGVQAKAGGLTDYLNQGLAAVPQTHPPDPGAPNYTPSGAGPSGGSEWNLEHGHHPPTPPGGYPGGSPTTPKPHDRR